MEVILDGGGGARFDEEDGGVGEWGCGVFDGCGVKKITVKKITKVHYSLYFRSTNIFLPNKNQQTPHGTENILSSHSKGNSQIKSLLQPIS